MTTTLYRNGRIHSPERPDASALLVQDGKITWLGPEGEAPEADSSIELSGALITPAFVDAHVHTTSTGLALVGLDLSGATDLADCLRQVESRGGALCYLLIGLQEGEALRRQYGNGFWNEVLHGVARRLQQLVRPLDVLTRVDDTHFGMIAMLDDLHECSPSSFKRLHEGLNLKAFKTSEGFISLKAGISLVGLDAKSLPVEPHYLFAEASRVLPESYASGRVSALRLPLPQ